jgi:hypothetical protein
MADADKASSTELLKSEYSCQPSWPQLQKGYRFSANWESVAKTCVLHAIAVAINKRPLAAIQAAFPNVR